MLPIYLQTMELLKSNFSDLTAVIHVAPNKRVEEHINKATRDWPVSVVVVGGESAHTKYSSFSVSNHK